MAHDDIDEAAKAIAARGARRAAAPVVYQKTANPNAATSTVDHGTASIVTKLKKELSQRGAKGMVGMGRKFRIMDDDGSKSLNMGEFKKAMKEMNMGLSDKELRVLFTHFDTDNSGSINFEEFIQGVRDPLSDRRRALVDWTAVELDEGKRTVRLAKAGMKLGLGGIVKGYTMDKAVSLLRKHDVKDFILKSGGELYVSGNPGGGYRRVGVLTEVGRKFDRYWDVAWYERRIGSP